MEACWSSTSVAKSNTMTAAVSSNRKHLLKQRLQYLLTQQNQTVFFPELVQITILNLEQSIEKEKDEKLEKEN